MTKILLIEDDSLARSVTDYFLSAKKFEVATAENGLIGLNLANAIEPDLIISDINMPYLNGNEVLKALRANSKTANIPFIFLTSEEDSVIRSRAFQLGANDYLTKPFQGKTLLGAIAAQLQPSQLCSISHERLS